MESIPSEPVATHHTNREVVSRSRKRKRRQLPEIGSPTILTESRTPTLSKPNAQNLPSSNVTALSRPATDSIEVDPIDMDTAN